MAMTMKFNPKKYLLVVGVVDTLEFISNEQGRRSMFAYDDGDINYDIVRTVIVKSGDEYGKLVWNKCTCPDLEEISYVPFGNDIEIEIENDIRCQAFKGDSVLKELTICNIDEVSKMKPYHELFMKYVIEDFAEKLEFRYDDEICLVFKEDKFLDFAVNLDEKFKVINVDDIFKNNKSIEDLER